jgi:3-oxoacyl-[acyl-carrier-protein] synthase-3
MGTRIETVATATTRAGWLGRGALHLADAAARACLARAGRRAGELDILINAGLYKNRNLAEPALAAIIQEDIGANPGHPPELHRHGTFSFDVVDGAGGVLTAAHLIDGLVGPGSARLGMVVAADADPDPRGSRGFPYSPAGGALLLAHDDGDGGFLGFTSRSFPEDADLYEATVRWVPHAGLTRRGRNLLEVREHPAFAARCLDHAAEVAAEFLAGTGLRGADVDLLIASQYPPGFAAGIARRLAIPAAAVPPVAPALARAHTAGPLAALDAAATSGRLDRARRILWVTAGAGITVAAALYVASRDHSR